MIVLGINGGFYTRFEIQRGQASTTGHDAAATLIVDGEVAAAVEQERIDRIKHSNCLPIEALLSCLQQVGITPREVDLIAINADEKSLDRVAREAAALLPRAPKVRSMRRYLADKLTSELSAPIDPARLHFVPHHIAHAMATFAQSDFDSSLVITVDAEGDGISGMVLDASRERLTAVTSLKLNQSLGYFYLRAISYLGFFLFDEYKVMGLACHGDRRKYADLFKGAYQLLPNGGFNLNLRALDSLLELPLIPRGATDPVREVHADIAAAIQDTLETIILHLLRHHRTRSGLSKLCLAGGVAHNSTMNGAILRSQIFEDVFVHPASHDAGGSLGAALTVLDQATKTAFRHPLKHVYWGPDLGRTDHIRDELQRWAGHITFVRSETLAEDVAQLLANDKVVGWVQGRSEFGPRALGNRSILADPRPAANRERINSMIKRREDFRPLAPSVLEEEAHDVFELPASVPVARFSFMNFTVPVRPKWRPILAAVTHVDGSARLQTVSRTTNRGFWQVIDAFRRLTGVPAVLNTSLNNDAEPMVNTVEDAIACFLTTSIDTLVVGNYLVSRTDCDAFDILRLSIGVPAHIILRQRQDSRHSVVRDLGSTQSEWMSAEVQQYTWQLLAEADGRRSAASLLRVLNVPASQWETIAADLRQLWGRRLVQLRPAITPQPGQRREEARSAVAGV